MFQNKARNSDTEMRSSNQMESSIEDIQELEPPPDLDSPPSTIPLKSMHENYEILEELGNGSFGSVTLAKYKINDCFSKDQDRKRMTMMDPKYNNRPENISNSRKQGLVAIKTMLTRLPTLHDYTRVREVKFILSMTANKHLIQVYEIFVDSEKYQLHIAMEYMEQNLYQMMRRRKKRVFSIPSLKSILAQVLAGLRHIHDQNFFHRDLKPENILITPSTRYFDSSWLEKGNYPDNYVVKLADFGLARHVENKNPYTAYVSTRWYRSPEILLRSGYYSKPLDIWAFGCVAMEVTVFKPLFPGSNEIDQIWKILEVLGTPHTLEESKNSNYIPHGGLWELSKAYAAKLNLKFPYVEGSSLEKLLCSSQLTDLLAVIKLCLKWDPNERASVEQLSSMPFFTNTVADNSIYEKENNTNKNTLRSIAEQALLFAGLPSSLSLKSLRGNIKLRDTEELVTDEQPNDREKDTNFENVPLDDRSESLSIRREDRVPLTTSTNKKESQCSAKDICRDSSFMLRSISQSKKRKKLDNNKLQIDSSANSNNNESNKIIGCSTYRFPNFQGNFASKQDQNIELGNCNGSEITKTDFMKSGQLHQCNRINEEIQNELSKPITFEEQNDNNIEKEPFNTVSERCPTDYTAFTFNNITGNDYTFGCQFFKTKIETGRLPHESSHSVNELLDNMSIEDLPLKSNQMTELEPRTIPISLVDQFGNDNLNYNIFENNSELRSPNTNEAKASTYEFAFSNPCHAIGNITF